MNIRGDISELERGIALVAKDLGLDAFAVEVAVSSCANGLSVSGGDGAYNVAYGAKSDFFRALALLAGSLKQGLTKLDINEKRQLNSCGVMMDCSRNAVLKPEALKDIFRKMAFMGLNMAMLYTEDTYEIEEYPYFGYMRGAYTKEELKDLDRYAVSLGIELIPCIQTLGHLKTALRWPFADNIKDRSDILLVGEPDTHKFIDAMLRSCRECFSTNKIHIGMDEAHDVGLGRYLDKHGFQNRFDILTRHLAQVTEMSAGYGFESMMWSDMFFRLLSPTGGYNDAVNIPIPADLPEKIPANVSQVYWDYYTEDFDTYRAMAQKHRELGNKVIFAGGIWMWFGMGMNYGKTFRTTAPALKACREVGITDVFATMWGDDGAEVNIYAALLGMQLYAEYAYYDEVDSEHLAERFRLCTGYEMSAFMTMEIDDYPPEWCHKGEALSVSKQALYQDVLLGLFDKSFEGIDLAGHYRKKLEVIERVKVPEGLEKLFDYQKQLLTVLIQKCDMGLRLADSYKKRDMTVAAALIDELETLYGDVGVLHQKFRELWLSVNKAFGLERVDLRFSGILGRIKVAVGRLTDLVEDRIDIIEELEVPRLMFGGEAVRPGKSLVECRKYEMIAVPAAQHPKI